MPKEPPTEIKSVIDTALRAFNSKDSALFSSTFGADAVIVDGVAPYRWTGPNAQGRWFADAEKWAHELGVTNENIKCDGIAHAEVIGTNAYVSLSATLSFTLKGQLGSRRGVLTFTFAKHGDEWKIESQAWGRLT